MNDLYQKIHNALRTDPRIVCAYVLGSFVDNNRKTIGDFDIAVVVDKKEVDYKEIYQLLMDIKFPADLDLSIVTKSSSPLFLFQVIKKGQLVYSRNNKDSTEFEEFVVKNYYDTQHIRNIYNSYLSEKFNLNNYAN